MCPRLPDLSLFAGTRQRGLGGQAKGERPQSASKIQFVHGHAPNGSDLFPMKAILTPAGAKAISTSVLLALPCKARLVHLYDFATGWVAPGWRASGTNDKKEPPMKLAITAILVATSFFAVASPAAAEKYIHQCKGSSVDNLITTTREPHHQTYWDACGLRFYYTQDKMDAIVRRCGTTDWRIKSHDRTRRICGNTSW